MESRKLLLMVSIIFWNLPMYESSPATTKLSVTRRSVKTSNRILPTNGTQESHSIDNVDWSVELHDMNLKKSDNPYVLKQNISAIATSSLNHSEKVTFKKSSQDIYPRSIGMEDEVSLQKLLAAIVHKDLSDCDLIIVMDRSFMASNVLQTLVLLPNFKQVYLMQSSSDLVGTVSWKSPRCIGLFLLLSELEPVIDFWNQAPSSYDYSSRTVMVGLTKEALETFIRTEKGRKTEQIIGVVKSQRPGYYYIYMNKLYWGEGLTQLATWRKKSFTNEATFFPDKISNLRKAPLNIAVFEWQPAIFFRRDAEGNVLLRYGRDVEVVIVLAEIFNFTLVYKDTNPDELFGHRLPNGSFNGQVGQMMRGEGDIGIANLWLSALAGRTAYQDYSSQFDKDTSCVMARIDPPLPLWQSPALPFKLMTWIATFVGLLMAGPILYILTYAGNKSDPEIQGYQPISISTLFAFGVHFSHPMSSLPKWSSTRVFVAFLWLYSIILTTGYRSNLIAFLTINKPPDSVETFQGIYDSDLRLVGIPYMKNTLESSSNPVMRVSMGRLILLIHAALELVKRYTVKMQFHEIEEELLEGSAVSFNSRNFLELVGGLLTTSRRNHKYRILKECYTDYAVGLAYQKNSPLKKKFDNMITRMFESGVVRRWFLGSIKLYKEFQDEDARSQVDDGKTVQDTLGSGTTEGVIPLGTSHTQGVFIVLCFGFLLATLSFGAESIIC